MKLSNSIVMLVAALSGAAAQHEDCSESVIASITEGHEYEHCSRDTGFELSANGSSELTAELLSQLCATHDCVELAAGIVDMGVTECEINGVHLLMDIVEPITEACAATGSASHAEGSMSMETSDDMATMASGAMSSTVGSMEMEASDDDVEASADATTASASAASSATIASTPTPSPTTSGAGIASLTASALLLTSTAAFAL